MFAKTIRNLEIGGGGGVMGTLVWKMIIYKDKIALFYGHVMECSKERKTAFNVIVVETEFRNNSILVIGRMYLAKWGSLLSAGQIQVSVFPSKTQ